MFLFGNKDGLLKALLARARRDELALLSDLTAQRRPVGLDASVAHVWAWLCAAEHRPLLRLWVEAYSRSLVDPDGPWAGFARATVTDWLDVLAASQEPGEADAEARRTLALAVLRGALLDLLATGDEARTTEAVRALTSGLMTSANEGPTGGP